MIGGNIFRHVVIFTSAFSLILAQRTEIPEGGTMTLDCRPQWQNNLPARWFTLKPTKAQLMYYNIDTGKNQVNPATLYSRRIDPNTLGVCIINNVQKNDSDEFECVVETIPYGTTKKFSFTIVARPTKPPAVPGSPQRVLRGESKVLTCHLDEDTNGNITYGWSRTTGEVTGHVNNVTGTLTFERSMADDQDNYTCRASNIAGHTENTVQLLVDYEPSSFTLTGYTPPEPLYSGDQQEMICQTRGGRPLPVLSWQCVQQTGTSTTHNETVTSRMVSTVMSAWDGEQCRCTATQAEAGITYNRMVTFNVYYPPVNPVVTLVNSPWLENTQQTARCQADQGKPTMTTFTWYNRTTSNMIKTEDTQQGQHVLTLRVTKEDNGHNLICLVGNKHTEDRQGTPASSQQVMVVEYSPRVTVNPPSSITVKENEDVTLNCSSDSNPAASDIDFRWTKDQASHTSGRELRLTKVKKGDAGTYRCTVTVRRNNGQQLTGYAQTQLVVQYLHVTPTLNQSVTEDNQFRISCSAQGVPGDITFADWNHVRDGIETQIQSTYRENDTVYLIRNSAKYTDAGSYTCHAGNGVYTDIRGQQEVTVFYTAKSRSPHSEDGEKRFSALGSSVVLEIRVHAHPPQVSFEWTFHTNDTTWTDLPNSDKHIINSSNLETRMTVKNISMDDFGKYAVRATNGVLNGSVFFFIVLPRDKPSPPLIDERRSHSTAISVSLYWQSNFNGGYSQTFSVHFKEERDPSYTEVARGIPDPGLWNTLSHYFHPLRSETKYNFRVSAHNDHNGSSRSDSYTSRTTKVSPKINNTTLVVTREGNFAHLRWEPPSGDYQWQIIEQTWISDGRQRRATATCVANSFTVHNFTKEVRNATVCAPKGERFAFQLVLYDQGVEVGRSGNFQEETVHRPVAPPSPVAAAVGGTLGGLVVAALVGLLLVLLLRRKRNASGKPDEEKLRENKDGNQTFTTGTNAAFVPETTPEALYAQPQKKNKGKKEKKENEQGNDAMVLYAPVKKSKKKEEPDSAEANVGAQALYAQVDTKDKRKNKKKEEDTTKEESAACPETVYAEVDKRKKGRKQTDKQLKQDQAGKAKPKKEKPKILGKKPRNKGPDGAIYENSGHEACYQNVKISTCSNENEETDAVGTGIHISKPPPGTEGLQYAQVEFVRKQSDKSVRPQAEEMTEYAEIDYKKKPPPDKE